MVVLGYKSGSAISKILVVASGLKGQEVIYKIASRYMQN